MGTLFATRSRRFRALLLVALVVLIGGVVGVVVLPSAGPTASAAPLKDPARMAKAKLEASNEKNVDREEVKNGQEIEPTQVHAESTAGSCGVERWSVKTGTDSDAGKINIDSTTSTTIAQLDGLSKPSSLPADSRITPTETTVYKLSATLTEYKLEDDSDYHLVLKDGSGNTMIAEIPDPSCVGSGSPLASSVQKARSEFDAKYTPSGSFQTANVPVTVTGVGFFDALHGQTGVAPNGIELHSVLDIQFSGSGGGSGGGTGCTTSQLFGNSGFETGTAAPWTASSNVISNDTAEPPHGGSWDAWLDGKGTAHTDTLSQAVTVPSGCTNSTLSFWSHIDSAEPTTTAYDKLTVQALDSSGNVLGTLGTLSNTNAAGGYQQHTYNIGAYAGKKITIKFTGTEDYTKQTSFVIDDTALKTA